MDEAVQLLVQKGIALAADFESLAAQKDPETRRFLNTAAGHVRAGVRAAQGEEFVPEGLDDEGDFDDDVFEDDEDATQEYQPEGAHAAADEGDFGEGDGADGAEPAPEGPDEYDEEFAALFGVGDSPSGGGDSPSGGDGEVPAGDAGEEADHEGDY